jgi:hypothetical protein
VITATNLRAHAARLAADSPVPVSIAIDGAVHALREAADVLTKADRLLDNPPSWKVDVDPFDIDAAAAALRRAADYLDTH